jgi:gamma-glutamyltranspeptidase/glutathione hydrolase
VAAGFASTVGEPGLTSIAGGGFATMLHPDGSSELLDFFTSVPGLHRVIAPPEPTTVTVTYPSAQQDFRVGPAAAAVPGMLSGLLELHRRHGTLPIATVVEPARRLATVGATIDSAQAYILELIDPIVRHTESAARIYAPGGRRLAEGDVLHDAELAEFLGTVARGEVTSPVSPAFAEPLLGMSAQGCPITAADLAAYRATWRPPLASRRHGWTLLTNPSPAYGGEIITRAVNDIADYSYVALTESLSRATAEVKGPLAATTGTTQISIVDANRFMVSMTTTNGAGGGVLIPGTGIHLNNMLGEDDLLPGGLDSVNAGERLRSMIAPTVLIAPDGTTTALGSGGSARIRSAIATVIVRLRDGAEALDTAIAGPRAHLEDSGVVQVEQGLSAESIVQLRNRFEVNEWDRRDFYFGGVNAVQRRPDGSVAAVADRRRNGSVAIVPPSAYV